MTRRTMCRSIRRCTAHPESHCCRAGSPTSDASHTVAAARAAARLKREAFHASVTRCPVARRIWLKVERPGGTSPYWSD